MKNNSMAALAVVVGMAAAGLATTALAQEKYGWNAAGAVTPTPSGRDFLMIAGGSDLYEIESSRAVLETTTNPGVRAFAEMMVAHHTKTMQDAAAAARAAGMEPPPAVLTAPQATMIASLRRFEGAERDRLYLTQQMMAHGEALGLMKTYAESGDVPELKAAAQATVPIIERHIAELQRLTR